MKKKPQKIRNPIAYCLAKRTGSGSGKHRNRVHDIRKGSSRKLKYKALIFASLFLLQSTAAAQTFVDQVDGGFALICSMEADNWTCEIISVEQLRELGWADVEGTIIIDEPVEEEGEETIKDKVPGC